MKNEYKRNEKLVTTQKVNQNTDICHQEHISLFLQCFDTVGWVI